MATQRPGPRRPTALTRRIVEVMDRLDTAYGRPLHTPRLEPVDELVCCILSQHSADVNSFPAFHALKARWPDWETVSQLDAKLLAETVKGAGLANQKAKSILGSLRAIEEKFGSITLEALRCQPVEGSLTYLTSLPGVGPKTAAIVMCFAFGKHAVPVDTHVHRVALRLRLIPNATTAEKAHVILDKAVPVGDAYRFHMLLIEHGRAVCTARSPRCPQCPINDICPWPGKSKAE